MRRESTVGDIDLAVCTSRKEPFRKDHEARERHADALVGRIANAPAYWNFPWEKEGWLERRSLYGARRHPLLAGAQQGATHLASLGVPCRLIFDRKRGGRVDDPILERHPDSNGRDPSLDPPAQVPDLTPAPIRPMDGRWVAGYSERGFVSPYDIFGGWTDEAHRMFAHYPENLRVFGDGLDLSSFPWRPKRPKQSGLDGRSSLLVVDATEWWGLRIVLHRTIRISDEKWTLHASFGDVELHRARKRVDLASTPSIVGALSVILAVDAERMVRRASELSQMPTIEIDIADDGLIDDVRDNVTDEIRANLESRSVRVEPDGWEKVVQVSSAGD